MIDGIAAVMKFFLMVAIFLFYMQYNESKDIYYDHKEDTIMASEIRDGRLYIDGQRIPLSMDEARAMKQESEMAKSDTASKNTRRLPDISDVTEQEAQSQFGD